MYVVISMIKIANTFGVIGMIKNCEMTNLHKYPPQQDCGAGIHGTLMLRTKQ